MNFEAAARADPPRDQRLQAPLPVLAVQRAHRELGLRVVDVDFYVEGAVEGPDAVQAGLRAEVLELGLVVFDFAVAHTIRIRIRTRTTTSCLDFEGSRLARPRPVGPGLRVAVLRGVIKFKPQLQALLLSASPSFIFSQLLLQRHQVALMRHPLHAAAHLRVHERTYT